MSRLVVALFAVDGVISLTDLFRDYGFFSNPSLGAIPFDALQYVAIIDTRSSPRSRAVDCMVIPTLATLTMPKCSASTENRKNWCRLCSNLASDATHYTRYIF